MKYVKFTLVKLIIRTLGVFFIVLMFNSLVYSIPKESAFAYTSPKIKTEISFSEDNNSSKKVLEERNITSIRGTEQLDTVMSESDIKADEISIQKSKKKIKNASGYFMSLVFDDSEIMSVKKRFIDFGEKFISKSSQEIYFNVVELIFEYPFILVLLLAIIFFILNIITVLIILNYTIKEKNRRNRFKEVYTKIYENVLLSYIFGEKDWNSTLIQLKNVERKANRRIIVDILFNFHENLKGDVSKYIPEIFVKLGLHKDSLKASKSMVYHKKTQAIRELTYLYPEGATEIISGLINDKNDKIRSEVQTSYIRLNQNHPFRFFKYLTQPFARWTQLSAFNLIRLHQLSVPSFAVYLKSKQYTVRNFCLRMITYYQQLENVSVIFQMLESEIEQTRYLTYKAINDLRLYDGKLDIKKKYRGETTKNKLEIVRALKNIGSEEDLDFLEIIIKSETVSLKTEACRSMYYMNEKGENRMKNLAEEFDPELELYISHITDPRN